MREPQPGDSDDERWVLADELSEQGDVRGELMALDLRIASSTAPDPALLARATSLRLEHRDALLGPLAPLVDECTWDRGALDTVELSLDEDALVAAACEDSRWNTVRAAKVVNSGPVALTRLLPHLRALERLTGRVPTRALVELAAGPPLPVVELDLARRSLNLADPDQPPAADILGGLGWSNVRHLVARDPVPGGYDPTLLTQTRVGGGLTTLEVPAPFVELPSWMRVFTLPDSPLESLRITEMLGNTSWTLTRGDERPVLSANVRLAILTVWRRSVKSDVAIAEVLDLLPPGCLDRVNVSIGSAYKGTTTTRRLLADAIERVTE